MVDIGDDLSTVGRWNIAYPTGPRPNRNLPPTKTTKKKAITHRDNTKTRVPSDIVGQMFDEYPAARITRLERSEFMEDVAAAQKPSGAEYAFVVFT